MTYVDIWLALKKKPSGASACSVWLIFILSGVYHREKVGLSAVIILKYHMATFHGHRLCNEWSLPSLREQEVCGSLFNYGDDEYFAEMGALLQQNTQLIKKRMITNIQL